MIFSNGGTAVAISAMTLEASKQTFIDGNYKFSVVSDNQYEIAKKFGLVIRIPNEIVDLYLENYKVFLPKFYPKKDIDVILPSTYVIDQNGMIVYTFVDEDFRKRADMTEVLRTVKKGRIDQKKYMDKCAERECEIQQFLKSIIKKVNRQSSSFFFKKKEKTSDDLFRSGSFHSDVSNFSDKDKDPFSYILNHEGFIDSFKHYLQKTFCMENLLFYFDSVSYLEEYSSKTAEENQARANIIIETFVRPGADLEVNIDDGTREKIAENFKEGLLDADLFLAAIKEVYHLMETDSYLKWKRTREYAELWKKNGSLEFLSPVPGFAAEAA